VVPDGEESFKGVSSCGAIGCRDVALSTADVALWELNWRKLGLAIAGALDCDSRDTDLGVPGTRQIGVFGDRSLPVVLTIQNSHVEFRNAVGLLVARSPEPFMLLAPTARFVDGLSQGLLANVKAGFFPLQEHFTLSSGGVLQAGKSGGELFGGLGRSTVGAVAAQEGLARSPEYLIRLEGTRQRQGKYDQTPVSTWRIWFKGGEILMPAWVGTEYLVFLIRNQGREFGAGALTEAVRKSMPGGGNEGRQMATEILHGQDGDGDKIEDLRGRVGDVNDRDVIWDKGEIAECLRKVTALDEEIGEHEAAGDRSSGAYVVLREKLEEQQDLLTANAKKVKGKWVPKEYQKGTFGDKADAIRKHFRKLLDDHLRDNCRPFYDHLNDRDTLEYGVRNRYQPKPRIEWKVHLKGGKTGM
jgi:hypothetical protein